MDGKCTVFLFEKRRWAWLFVPLQVAVAVCDVVDCAGMDRHVIHRQGHGTSRSRIINISSAMYLRRQSTECHTSSQVTNSLRSSPLQSVSEKKRSDMKSNRRGDM